MRCRSLPVLALVLALAPAAARGQPPGEPSAVGRWAWDAWQEAQVRIELGQLALRFATGNPLRELGEGLVADGMTAQTMLNRLAAEQGFLLPAGLEPGQRARMGQIEAAVRNPWTFDGRLLSDIMGELLWALNDYHAVQEWAEPPELKRFAREHSEAIGARIRQTADLLRARQALAARVGEAQR